MWTWFFSKVIKVREQVVADLRLNMVLSGSRIAIYFRNRICTPKLNFKQA